MKTLMAVVDPRYAVAAVLTVDIAPGEYGVAVANETRRLAGDGLPLVDGSVHSTVLLCHVLIELTRFDINVPFYFNFE